VAISFDWLKDHGLGVIVFIIFTIGVGIYLSEVQTKIGWSYLLLGLILAFVLFLSMLIIIVRPIERSLERFVITSLRYIEPKYSDWLKDTQQLAEFELADPNFKEIWLITTDLQDDIPGGPFETVVTQNLKKNIQYYYFVPNTHEIKARVKQVKRHFKNNRHLHFIYLPDTFYLLVPNLDIAVYNPFESRSRAAFMGIPSLNKENHFHAMMSNEFMDRLVGYLSELDEYKLEADH
jgi:hypothetical protein